jgi:hypothetical protein
MSTYSAQLIVAVAFKKVDFHSLSYEDMVKAAKVLGIKSRGIGKYDLAQKMAIQLVEQQYVQIARGGILYHWEEMRSNLSGKFK